MGLRQFGYKDIGQIRLNWLPNKREEEIKHRYKNMTCAKASENLIKKWKIEHNKPLTVSEEE